MLGDVFTTVSDGLLGFSTNKGTGIFTAIGASPVKARPAGDDDRQYGGP